MTKAFHTLDPAHTDPVRVKREREKARELKKSQWWLNQLQKGVCHYCHKKFHRDKLTMDHVIPIARGGTSTRGNVVPACQPCNANKKLDTPVDDAFAQLERERIARAADTGKGEGTGTGNGTGDSE